MMRALRRFTSVVRTGLDAFLAPAEDPRQTFAGAFERQGELLANVQQALVDVVAAKRRLEARATEIQARLPRLEEQARASLTTGREDLARLALERRQVSIVELQTLAEQVRELEQEDQRLCRVEERLATQIEAFYARQEVIAARYGAAEVQVRINEALSGVSQELTDLGLALEQAEQKAERMQAYASAIDSMIETGVLKAYGLRSEDAFDRQLAQMDVGPVIENQLAELRRQIRDGKESPPAGT